MPARNTVSRPIGSHIAQKMPFGCGARDAAVAAAVPTVSVEVPEPLAIEFEAKAHVGAGVTTGAMLQLRLTVPLKPLTGAIVMVEVADPPAATVAGESAEAATVKSANVA